MSIAKNINFKLSIDSILYFCIPALFFVTPLSSSAKSIFLGISVAIILLTPKYRKDLISLFANKYCLTVLLLFFLTLIGCFWSPATLAEKGLIIEKWSKLLYLPVLIIGLSNPKTRRHSLNAFLCAMLLTCLCSLYLKYASHPIYVKAADSVFRNHIMTGLMMSFAAYLSGILFLKSKNTARIFYLVIGLLFSYQILFINEGRTGYVLYLLLTGLLFAQNMSKRQALISILALGIGFAGCCYLNQPLWSRIKLVHTEWNTYKQNKDTSIGFRMQFHNYADNLFHKSPIIGNGTGSFTYLFKTENPVPGWTSMKNHSGRLLEPHSQYWLVAAEFGILGLFALALFYSELFIRFYKLKTMRPVALALFSVVIVGNLTDSLLFYSGSGYFFILFFALFLSESTTNLLAIRADSKVIKNEPINDVFSVE
jgi:O-antigen ligase